MFCANKTVVWQRAPHGRLGIDTGERFRESFVNISIQSTLKSHQTHFLKTDSPC